jgi:histidyl-tRNA synthetase
MSELIEPRVLKGFRDMLPENELVRRSIEVSLEHTIRSFGFVPIDTPVLEYAEILLGKGGGETDKQVYRFNDHGGRDVALRFDLTVPFARFMATYGRELALPFKRFHIAKVWRGENTQRGRYREFKQCDFDIVGIDSVNADLEIILLIENCFRNLGISGFTIEISQRQVFNRLLDRLECSGRSTEILRLVDKLPKIGRDKVMEGLEDLIPSSKAREVIEYIEIDGSYKDALDKAEESAGGPSEETSRLRSIGTQLADLGVSRVRFNPSITRGLDYYTGIVYETFLTDLPAIGSVCSGGRYNNLASLYTKQELPGVGASIGLDRLLAALDELGKVDKSSVHPQVLVFMLDESLNARYQRIAAAFREQGISTEVFLQKKKINQQFQFAEKKGIRIALICGSEEAEKNQMNLKILDTRENLEGISLEAAIAKASSVLGNRRTP